MGFGSVRYLGVVSTVLVTATMVDMIVGGNVVRAMQAMRATQAHTQRRTSRVTRLNVCHIGGPDPAEDQALGDWCSVIGACFECMAHSKPGCAIHRLLKQTAREVSRLPDTPAAITVARAVVSRLARVLT